MHLRACSRGGLGAAFPGSLLEAVEQDALPTSELHQRAPRVLRAGGGGRSGDGGGFATWLRNLPCELET